MSLRSARATALELWEWAGTPSSCLRCKRRRYQNGPAAVSTHRDLRRPYHRFRAHGALPHLSADSSDPSCNPKMYVPAGGSDAFGNPKNARHQRTTGAPMHPSGTSAAARHNAKILSETATAQKPQALQRINESWHAPCNGTDNPVSGTLVQAGRGFPSFFGSLGTGRPGPPFFLRGL